jgi:hypothetical protein
MGAIAFAFGGRLARRWRSWIGLGLLLGVGFGIGLSTLAAARHTASAYTRIVRAAQTPDATSGYTQPTADAERRLAGLRGVESLRSVVGFTGYIEGVDPAYTRGLLGPWGDYFPVEAPQVREGRLPDPLKRNEIFVNAYLADHAGIAVGDDVRVSILVDNSSNVHTENFTVTGIGTSPRELVADETSSFGSIILSSAIARELSADATYRLTNFNLAPGVSVQKDLYPQLRERGFELNETLTEGVHRVQAAIRPLLALLVTFGAVLLISAAGTTVQVVLRGTAAWAADDRMLQVLGLSPRKVLAVRVAGAMVTGLTAAATALVVMAATSPVGSVGTLHGPDPASGVYLDLTVFGAGVILIVLITLATAALAGLRWGNSSPTATGRRRMAIPLSARPTAIAGLSFGNPRAGQHRRRAWSSIGVAAAAVALTAAVVTLGSSANALVDQPKRYGYDWDVIALNAFADQEPATLQSIFGGDPAVAAATGFASDIYVVNGTAAVSGFAITNVKGSMQPTLVAGRAVRAADEVALGRDSLASIGATIGDEITIKQVSLTGVASATATVRIVGAVTFPPVSQTGTDQPRLGTGILLTAEGRQRLGIADNPPEWTAIRLARGARAHAFIAAHPQGVPTKQGTPTEWFTSAAPAEIQQLDGVLGLVLGAAAVSFTVMLAILSYALLAQVRTHRRDMAVLHAVGFTQRQLAVVVAWQSLPLAVVSTLIGIPIGIELGRRQYTAFARRLGVIESPSTSPLIVVGLVAGVLVALSISVAAAMMMARRTRSAQLLRSG